MWRDADGTISAVCYPCGPDRRLHVPRIGTFTLSTSSDLVRLVPLAGVSSALIDDAFHRIAVPMAVQVHGLQVLHGSAIAVDGGVVALCGRSGGGKSTTAYAMHRRGWDLWADDAVAFRVDGDRAEAHPLPFRMRLRPESAAWFAAPEQTKGSELGSPWLGDAEAARLRAVVLLAPTTEQSDPSEAAAMARLAPADAFRELLPHAYYVSLTDESVNRRLLTAYLDLAERLPVFSLRYVPRLEQVDAMCGLIERHVTSA